MSRISTSNLGIPGLSKKPVREVKEEDLLDDIEATTKRLYQQVMQISCHPFLRTTYSHVDFPVVFSPYSSSVLTIFLLPVQSRNINDESKTHIHLLTKVESDMTAESVALRAGNPQPSPIASIFV